VKKNQFVKLAVIGVAASVFPLVGAGQAFGDYAPQPNDIVGVGGDTPQYAVDFALNGAPTTGAAGFDQDATVNRVVSFLATPDANGRSAYTNSVSTGAASTGLDPTDVLRAGTTATPRVSSSGAAISALLADTGTTENINFISSASEPTSGNQTTAANNGWGYLHTVEIGTDSVQIVADTTTNAPTGLSIAELLGIYNGTYTTWNALPDNGSGSTATILPEIPPSGSSIYKTFIADLTTANGGTAPTLAGDVKTVEQNDPTTVTGSSSPANAIVPFSSGRLNLFNNGYFKNSGQTTTWGLPSSFTSISPGVKFLNGATPDSGTAYDSPITDYIIFRESDATSTTPLEPGGTKNWVQTLFSDPGGTAPYFDKAAGQALLAAAGITPIYNDLGDVN
jgi:ABC-type phosphate transport system substrate-binding protein